jgi:hypothetical protein
MESLARVSFMYLINLIDEISAVTNILTILQRGDPHINKKNIFNTEGVEWKRRRGAFRQAFTVSNVRHFQSEMRAMSQNLSSRLLRAAEIGSVLEIDTLFGQLAVDVICNVGFQYDMHALNGKSDMFQVLHQSVRDDFEVGQFICFISLNKICCILSVKGSNLYPLRTPSHQSAFRRVFRQVQHCQKTPGGLQSRAVETYPRLESQRRVEPT